jgi:hypothetical protein
MQNYTLSAIQLTLYPLTTTIVAPPRNAIKWQMGFNSAFKVLVSEVHHPVLKNTKINQFSEPGSIFK